MLNHHNGEGVTRKRVNKREREMNGKKDIKGMCTYVLSKTLVFTWGAFFTGTKESVSLLLTSSSNDIFVRCFGVRGAVLTGVFTLLISGQEGLKVTIAWVGCASRRDEVLLNDVFSGAVCRRIGEFDPGKN